MSIFLNRKKLLTLLTSISDVLDILTKNVETLDKNLMIIRSRVSSLELENEVKKKEEK